MYITSAALIIDGKIIAACAEERLNRNKLTISANNLEEGGSGIEEIEINYNGPTLDIGFNAGYLKEIIHQFNGKEVTILFSDSTAPTIIKDIAETETLYVLMPMRV